MSVLWENRRADQLVVRFIRHGESQCNAYFETEDRNDESMETMCSSSGGGNPDLSKRGTMQARSLNKSIIAQREDCTRVSFQKNNIEYILYGQSSSALFLVSEPFLPTVIRSDKRGKEKTKRPKETPRKTKIVLPPKTKVFSSSMKRAFQTAQLALANVGNAAIEQSPLIEETIGSSWEGDTEFKRRYVGFEKFCKSLKADYDANKVKQAIVVCHHNTIRYLVCILCRIFDITFPSMRIDAINARFLDVAFCAKKQNVELLSDFVEFTKPNFHERVGNSWKQCENYFFTNQNAPIPLSQLLRRCELKRFGNVSDSDCFILSRTPSSDGKSEDVCVFRVHENRPDLFEYESKYKIRSNLLRKALLNHEKNGVHYVSQVSKVTNISFSTSIDNNKTVGALLTLQRRSQIDDVTHVIVYFEAPILIHLDDTIVETYTKHWSFVMIGEKGNVYVADFRKHMRKIRPHINSYLDENNIPRMPILLLKPFRIIQTFGKDVQVYSF